LNGKTAVGRVRKGQDKANRTHRLTALTVHQQSMDRMAIKIVFLEPIGVLRDSQKAGFNAIDAVSYRLSLLDELWSAGLDDLKITIEALQQRFPERC
jgi:hypothetical protein